MAASELMAPALAAAATARGRTSPNPWVGAVIVRDGRVLATGATQPPGGDHAEAEALSRCDAHGATMFVTLEPCAPFPGKRTPPCASRIIQAGVSRVVIALEDPDPRVRGRGIALLREAGIDVEVGDGASDAMAQLRPYLKHCETGLPYVIAKFAASLDGRTATASGDSKWITGEEARNRAHEQRAWVDAIMVGSGTVLADDPSLTARPSGQLAARQPMRVILDARGRSPATAAVFTQPGATIVATTSASETAWRGAIAATGAQVILCEASNSGVNLDQLLQTLGQRGVLSIWAEGGGTLLGALFDGSHVDELWAFLAPLVIGGTTSLPAVGGAGAPFVRDAWGLREVQIETLGRDLLVRGFVGDWSPAIVVG